MEKENKTSNKQTEMMREHELRNEGGREFGHVHGPTQAQQASNNQGLADNGTARSGTEKGLKRAREGSSNAA
jgi:hypothetical protein